MVAACLFSVSCLSAETLPPPSTNNPAATLEELARLDPALAQELEKLKIRRWDVTVNVALGAGYKDNVLLSRDNKQASPFLRLGAEATVLRLPQNGWTFSSLVSWEDYRYTRPLAVDREQTGMALAEIKKAFTDSAEVALRGQYLYLDQVLDLSDQQGIIQPLPVRLHSPQPRLISRLELGRNYFAELEMGGALYEYQTPVDDFWEAGPQLKLGRRYGNRSEISLGFEYNHRWYDTRRATDATGLPLAAMPLEYSQKKTMLTWRHHWDEKHRWRTTLRLRLDHSADNGADYYTYWKYSIQPQLRYQQAGWHVQTGARWTYYDYPRQPLYAGSGAHYQRSELDLTLNGEIKLNRELRFQWEYRWERNDSNLILSEYRAHTVWAGVIWEF